VTAALLVLTKQFQAAVLLHNSHYHNRNAEKSSNLPVFYMI